MTRDLMYKDEIQQLVAEAYLQLDDPDGFGTMFYADEQLARLPDATRPWMLGVGNPVAYAELRPGEQVVDLGCGSGADVLLAAQEVGPSGQATGIDLLPEMVARARAAAAEAGTENVAFEQGEIEDLPLDDDRADVALSNGSINLCARKSRVLSEAYRVLRPGGRLTVADLTIREEELPSEVITHPSAWAG